MKCWCSSELCNIKARGSYDSVLLSFWLFFFQCKIGFIVFNHQTIITIHALHNTFLIVACCSQLTIYYNNLSFQWTENACSRSTTYLLWKRNRSIPFAQRCVIEWLTITVYQWLSNRLINHIQLVRYWT